MSGDEKISRFLIRGPDGHEPDAMFTARLGLIGARAIEAEAEEVLVHSPLVPVRKATKAKVMRTPLDSEFAIQEAEEAKASGRIGYYARVLLQATLPHSKQEPQVTEFTRTNGDVTVRIQAPKQYGLPYGHYPRLLLAWMSTEAVRTQSPCLELGDSLGVFMAKLDLVPTGGAQGTMRRLRQHIQSLFSSTISTTYQTKDTWIDRGFRPVEESTIFWDPRSSNQVSLWKSTIRLNQTFYQELVEHPVPIDLRVLGDLAKRRSSLAIDIYMWLTYRFSYLSKPTTIPWKSLAGQFGADYERPQDFKVRFLGYFKYVTTTHYPQVRAEVEPHGLVLFPSRTHVPKLLKRS